MKHKSFQLAESDVRALRAAGRDFQKNDFGNIRASVHDLFALGLFLRMLGHKEEGYKACSHALRTLGLPNRLRARILKHLDGNEQYLAETVWAHVEFLNLLQKPRRPGRT